MTNRNSKYKIELTGDSDMTKFMDGITYAKLTCTLDNPAVLEVHIALPLTMAAELSLDKLPTIGKITIDENIVFSGHVCNSQLSSRSSIILSFKDPLQLLDNLNCEFFKQEISVEDCIKEVLRNSELTANFVGDFSTMIGSYHVDMMNASALLSKLSSEFAFHYKYQPRTKKIDIIKIGEKLTKQEYAATEAINILLNEHTSEQMSDEIEYTYLTSNNSELKSETLGASQVASSYNDLSKSGSFKTRSKWPSAKGNYKFRFNTKNKFLQAKETIKNISLKESVDQDSILIESFKLKALPGDHFKFSSPEYPSIQDGLYLVKSTQITFSSLIPTIIVQGVRP